MVKTTYVCDRCGAESDSRDDVEQFLVDESGPKYETADLCQSCLSSLRNMIGEFIAHDGSFWLAFQPPEGVVMQEDCIDVLRQCHAMLTKPSEWQNKGNEAAELGHRAYTLSLHLEYHLKNKNHGISQ